MRNLIFTLALFLSSFVITYAQGFYFKAGIGYAFAQNGETLDGNGFYGGSYTNTMSGIYDYRVKPASFGAGLQGSLTFGKMFSKHIGLEIQGMVGIVNKQTTYAYNSDTLNDIPTNLQIKQKAQAPLIFIPSIVLQTGGDKLNLYMRAGLALPVRTSLAFTVTLDQLAAGYPVIVEDWKYKSGFNLGFAGAFGASVNTAKYMNIWLEAKLVSLTVYSEEADMTDYKENGTSYFSQVNPIYKTMYFKKNSTSSTAAPYYYPSYSIPFSSIGINAGITYTFHKSKLSKELDEYRKR